MSIHPSALIDPSATLAENVSIGPYCVIEADVEIAEGCALDAQVQVKTHTKLGAHCKVHSGVVLGDVPQDLGFDASSLTYTEIGSHNVFREGFTVHRGTAEDSVTRIGSHCYFMANSHVAHNCDIGDHVIMANGVLLGGYVHIGERAFISGNSVIHQFVHIGRLAMAGGLSGLSQNVPPFCTTHPVHLNSVIGLNTVGMKRAGLSLEERSQVKQIFKIIFRSSLNTTQAIKQCRENFSGSIVDEMLTFIEGSKRGICSYTDG